MREISGAIIAITLVMSAVFIPVSFLSGPSGVFYREFSLTMAVAIVLSGVTALTLTPALCALFLKNNHGRKKDTLMNRFFVRFNRFYDGVSNRYTGIIAKIVSRRLVTFGVLIAFSLGAGLLGNSVPSGFLPAEDQGTIYANITKEQSR